MLEEMILSTGQGCYISLPKCTPCANGISCTSADSLTVKSELEAMLTDILYAGLLASSAMIKSAPEPNKKAVSRELSHIICNLVGT